MSAMSRIHYVHAVLASVAILATSPVGQAKIPSSVVEELPAWRTHGTEVQFQAVRELIKMGNTFAALDIIRKMRTDKVDAPELDLLQGQALRIDGVASEAERMLLLAQKRLGRDARPAAELCILYADLRRMDEAVSACQRATQLDEQDAASWNNLGFLLLSQDRAEEALAACEHAVQVDATQPRYRNNLGMAQAATGHLDLAFRTLKSTMPTGDAAYMVGVVRQRYGTEEEAQAWMNRALKHDPRHPQAVAWLAEPNARGADAAPTVPSPESNDGAPAPAEVP